MRVICAGDILEDISDYGRLHQMFHMMKPSEARMNDAIEGVGVSESLVTTLNNADEASTLAKDEKQTICFTPLSGILMQDKFLPIRYCPLQFEFEIVGNANDAVQGSANTGDAKSESFLIDDVQIKCDLVTLDSQLENEYSGHLLSGKSLPIHFSTFTSSSQVITSIDTHVNVSRSLTRLKSVYVSLFKPSGAPSYKEVNYFWHPMSGVDYDRSKELEFQMQIGAKSVSYTHLTLPTTPYV